VEEVQILRNDNEAKLIFDDMRREILRLLARESLTPRKLSTILGLSAPTVGHHLDVLKRSGLVRIVATEAETHGIVQKFYSATAQTYIIETRRLSPSVKRYFMPARIERTRGLLAALSLNSADQYEISSELVETATEELATHIVEVSERRQGHKAEKDPERVINEIYRDALSDLISAKPNMFRRVNPDLSASVWRAR